MVKEAEANKEADAKKKEEADVKNEAEQMIFTCEKSLKDLGDKVSEDEKKEAEEQIKELKDALEKDNLEDIKAKKDKLQETAYKFAAKVYEEAAKNNQTEETTESKDE